MVRRRDKGIHCATSLALLKKNAHLFMDFEDDRPHLVIKLLNNYDHDHKLTCIAMD